MLAVDFAGSCLLASEEPLLSARGGGGGEGGETYASLSICVLSLILRFGPLDGCGDPACARVGLRCVDVGGGWGVGGGGGWDRGGGRRCRIIRECAGGRRISLDGIGHGGKGCWIWC